MNSLNIAYWIIRHLDAVDKEVSKRLAKKRPWLETALTSLLCDLLDEEEQEDYHLEYPFAQFRQDLVQCDPYLNIRFSIATHEYSPQVENWVTQSDIGLIINFHSYSSPQECWSVAWLLQAKRLLPNHKSKYPFRYSEKSRFDIDKEQKSRIDILTQILGVNCIKYLLYCPRFIMQDKPMTDKQTEKILIDNLYRSFDNSNKFIKSLFGSHLKHTLSYGIFVNETNYLPSNLYEIYNSLFTNSLPLSWFVAEHFLPKDLHKYADFKSRIVYGQTTTSHSGSEYKGEEWVHGIVSGNPQAISQLIAKIEDRPNKPKNFSFLPAHTINIEINSQRELPIPIVEEDEDTPF